MQTIPTALIRHHHSPNADALALAWAIGKGAESGDRPLIYLPTRRSGDNHAAFRQAAKRGQVTEATWKQPYASGWSGGPVIVAWPDAEHLGECASWPHVTALCVIAWEAAGVHAWARAFQPEVLDDPATYAQAGSEDPVVRAALGTLEHRINDVNGWDSRNRATAAAVIRTLRSHGHTVAADDVYSWAMQRWRHRAAWGMRTLVRELDAGKQIRVGPSPFIADVYDIWAAAARDE